MHDSELQGSAIHTTSAASLCGGILGESSVWANMTELAYATLLCYCCPLYIQLYVLKSRLNGACTTLHSKVPSFTPLARHRYVVASFG